MDVLEKIMRVFGRSPIALLVFDEHGQTDLEIQPAGDVRPKTLRIHLPNPEVMMLAGKTHQEQRLFSGELPPPRIHCAH